MRILFAVVAFFLLSCGGSKVEYGSVEGNVYWKYNDFVGNRPDAGAEIRIINNRDSLKYYTTTADVRGDWSFDSIPAGYYVLVVKSESTKSSNLEFFRELSAGLHFMDTVYHFGDEFLDPIRDSIRFLQNSMDSLIINYNPETNEYSSISEVREQMEALAKRALSQIPLEWLMRFGIYSTGNKIDVHSIGVYKQTKKKIVTDFGISYY